MATINYGMLTPAEAQAIIIASKGWPLFPDQVSNTQGSENFQNSMVCGFLLDMLAGGQVLWPKAYNLEDGNPNDAARWLHQSNLAISSDGYIGDSLVLVLVINQLPNPLKKTGENIYAGETWAAPGGPLVDTTLRTLQADGGEVVPGADQDGNLGFALWAYCNAEPAGAISLGLSLSDGQSGFSLGALMWNAKLHAINLSSDPSATVTVQNNAYYDQGNNGSGTKNCSAVTNFTCAGNSVAATINASMQLPDPTNAALIVVSITPASSSSVSLS
jgi:hypothetical protein